MKLITALARRCGSEDTRGIWASDKAGPSGRASALEKEVHEQVAELQKELQEQLAVLNIQDAESRFHLATAYREMGLVRDAVVEASAALACGLSGPFADEALGMLVTPPLLLPGGLTLLRERLRVGLLMH